MSTMTLQSYVRRQDHVEAGGNQEIAREISRTGHAVEPQVSERGKTEFAGENANATGPTQRQGFN